VQPDPNNGLASLAATLEDAGHTARITNFGSVGTIRRLPPPAICERPHNVAETIFGHVNALRRSDLEPLKRSVCYAVFYGMESGSQDVLDRGFNKGVKVKTLRQALETTKQVGLKTIASIIYPGPFETAETRDETLQLLLDVRPDSVPVHFAGLMPNTDWWENPEKYGFELTADPNTVLRRGLTCKIKVLFPPSHWDELPYTLNGKTFRLFAAETEAFTAELEHNGILTNVGHNVALMDHIHGSTMREFRDLCRKLLYCGDWEPMQDVVNHISRNQQASVRQSSPA